MVLGYYKPMGLVGCVAVVRDILHAGRDRATLPGTEEPRTTIDFLTDFFGPVDDHMPGLPTHPHATLWPSAVVTLGLLHALTGVGNRAVSRWLTQDSRGLCPR